MLSICSLYILLKLENLKKIFFIFIFTFYRRSHDSAQLWSHWLILVLNLSGDWIFFVWGGDLIINESYSYSNWYDTGTSNWHTQSLSNTQRQRQRHKASELRRLLFSSCAILDIGWQLTRIQIVQTVSPYYINFSYFCIFFCIFDNITLNYPFIFKIFLIFSIESLYLYCIIIYFNFHYFLILSLKLNVIIFTFELFSLISLLSKYHNINVEPH